MENNQKRSYAHPYGSTLIPHMHLGGGGLGHPSQLLNGRSTPPVPGAPSVIPGTIGVAGNKITETGPAEQPPSSIAKFVDGFIEQLVERAAELVVEKVFERFELIKQAAEGNDRWQKQMAVQEARDVEFKPEGSPQTASNGAEPQMLAITADYAQTLAPDQAPILTVNQEAAEAHQLLQAHLRALPAFAAGKLVIVRYAPSPLVFRVVTHGDGLGAHLAIDPDNMGGYIEWSAYSAAYDSPRFPVKASPGKYMVLVNGVRLDPHRARCEEISAELRATFVEEETQGLEAIRPRQIALEDEKRALEAAQGLTLDEIIEKVVEAVA